MWADTHCHLDAKEELNENDIRQAISKGVKRFAIAGVTGCSGESLHLAKTYREIYLMAGIHPLFIHKTDETSMKHIQKIATENPKCIAIGEIGLDYYGKNVNREKQKTVFREQLELAKGLGLSVSIHLRRAFPDFLEIIRNYSGLIVIMHMYSGSLEFAGQLLRVLPDVYFSFGGPAIRANAHKAHKVLKGLPRERILVETDSPDLPPPGMSPPNVPSNLPKIGARLATILCMKPTEFETLTWKNAKEAFRW